MTKNTLKLAIIGLVLALMLGSYFTLDYFGFIPHKVYSSRDFGIAYIESGKDFDNDGIEDFQDILEGAQLDAKNRPLYKSAYYSGGYPPENEGVCTDLIWRAFLNAGYILKDYVDEDIINHQEKYTQMGPVRDPNIDFRRVKNLMVFFEKNSEGLTTDLNSIEDWQAGDIVIFSDHHMGIVSDKRNKKGIPYLIHNASQPNREEDTLERWAKKGISGHYRWHGYNTRK